MNADADLLISLAGIHVGLFQPASIPVGEPQQIGPLLSERLDEGTLTQLRESTAARLSDPACSLDTALGALIETMGGMDLDGSSAPTLPGGLPRGLDAAFTSGSVSTEAPGRYRFPKEHARGGMGRILVVHDEFLDRRIALKELLDQRSELSGDSTVKAANPGSDPTSKQQRDQFLYEARITGYLEHPSIVPVYELGQRENGALYYTMRLVKGRSLRIAIKEAENTAARLLLLSHFVDLCQAIAFAHDRGVLHRDIKPGNVMVGEFGETVVIDWGLARLVQEGETPKDALFEPDATGDALAIGTPAYMAPEQAAGGVSRANTRCDIYSLGAVLYQVLTGRAPYADRTSASVLRKLLAGPPPEISTVAPDVPEELAAICAKAMNREPTMRYQSAQDLAADIERFRSGHRVVAYDYSVRELLTYFAGRFKGPLIVGAVGVVGIATSLFLSYEQIQAERDRAVAESERALAAEKQAREAQEFAEQEFYFAAIASARKDISDGRYDRAMQQLDACPPRFRHWEWGYLLYLCNQDQQTLQAHEPETIWSLEYLPGGTHLASAGFDNAARIWPKQGSEPTQTYTSPHGAVIEISPHPSEPVIACAEENGYLTFYDYQQGVVRSSRQLTEEDVNCIQFHPDGTRYLTGDDDGKVRLWDYPAHTERYAVTIADPGVECIAFNRSGTLFANCDRSTQIEIRDTETGQVQLTLTGHTGRNTGLAFSPDGAYFASSSRDGTARIWDLQTGATIQTLTGHVSAVWAVRFSPDGTHLATCGSDLTVRVWDTSTWQATRIYRGHQRQVDALAFSPDGRTLRSGDDAGTLKEWDTVFPGPHTDMWALRGHSGTINHVTYSPDGTVLVSSAGDWKTSDDTTAGVWDAETGTLLNTLSGHGASVRHASFHPGESVLATASHDKTVRIWQGSDFASSHVLGPFIAEVNVTAFSTASPDVIAVGLRDGQLRLVNWRDGTILHKWAAHTEEVLALRFSPNGAVLVSSSADESVHISDATSGELVRTIGDHASRVPALAFSPDGKLLATGGHDWRINLWETDGWTQVDAMEGHTQGIYTLSFSDDGRRLLSSSSDGSSILWDMDTRRDVLSIQGRVGALRPGSQDLATGMPDGSIYLWPSLPWDADVYADGSDATLRLRCEAEKQRFWQARNRH